jgi:chromosome segregation ATPase
MVTAALLPIAAVAIWGSTVAIIVGAISMGTASLSTTKALVESLIAVRQQAALTAETQRTELLEQLSTLTRELDQSQVRIADIHQLFEELRLEHRELTTTVESLDSRLHFQYKELTETVASMHSHVTGRALTDV